MACRPLMPHQKSQVVALSCVQGKRANPVKAGTAFRAAPLAIILAAATTGKKPLRRSLALRRQVTPDSAGCTNKDPVVGVLEANSQAGICMFSRFETNGHKLIPSTLYAVSMASPPISPSPPCPSPSAPSPCPSGASSDAAPASSCAACSGAEVSGRGASGCTVGP